MSVEIQQVAEDTYSLDCGKDPIFEVRQIAYLVMDEAAALIDPGSTSSVSQYVEACAQHGIDIEKLKYIVPTHIHVDHGGGSGYLAERLPGSRVVLHPRGAVHMKSPERLTEGVRAVFGQDFDQVLGPILPVPEKRMLVADDGETIRLGRRQLTIYYAPGHAPHHIAIHDSLTDGLFCGDALGYISDEIPGLPVPVGTPPFDLEAYVQTIDRLAALEPSVVFYGHHGARTDAGVLMKQVRDIVIAFGDMIQESLAAGDDDERIAERVLEYLRQYHHEARLPLIVQASIPGYVGFYRDQMT